MQFTFHVVGLPHTEVTKEFLPCAYTQKVLNFCKMMKSLGHKVILYSGGDKTDVEVDEFVSVVPRSSQEKYFGETDWRVDFFPIIWELTQPYWHEMNGNTIKEIGKRIGKTDFICVIGGYCHKPIADAFPAHQTVEFGVGYPGVFSNYKVFESYSYMHQVYGQQKFGDGQNYDTVIPNYFDVNDFPEPDYKPDDYFLFIGRLVSRKGAHIAAEACGRMGVKLKMAGQGVISKEKGKIVAKELELSGDFIEHVGTVGVKERFELMSKAKAVFVPTVYLEPFGGVAIEAMLSGAPIITSDWGAFTETNQHGKTGFRTRTLGEVMWAMKNVDKLDRKKIREYAIANYSLDRVKEMYQAYFEQLYELWNEGWYSELDSGVSKYKRYEHYYI